jgi:hypothetical protein
LQNPQLRVQTFPKIMNVAVERDQHSPRFGQAADSQTVLSLCSVMSDFTSR